MLFKLIQRLLAVTIFSLGLSTAQAQAPSTPLLDPSVTDTMSALLCSDATQQFMNPLSYLCIDSIFPIRVAGTDSGQATDMIGAPYNAYSSPTCECSMFPSFPIGMWVPDRFIETVEQPGCSPLTGINLSKALTVAVNKVLPKGRDSPTAEGGGNSQAGFRHVNIWQSNLADQLSLPVAKCQPKVPFETTLIWPFWNANDPVTPNLLFPEWNLIFEAVIGFPQTVVSCVNATLGFKCIGSSDAGENHYRQMADMLTMNLSVLPHWSLQNHCFFQTEQVGMEPCNPQDLFAAHRQRLFHRRADSSIP